MGRSLKNFGLAKEFNSGQIYKLTARLSGYQSITVNNMILKKKISEIQAKADF